MNATFIEVQKQATAAQASATAAQNAVTQARDQFRQDQRPYIWLTNNGIGQPELIANPNTNPLSGQIVWTYHTTNYGKAPAYDLFSYKLMKVGNQQFRESYGFSRATQPGSKGPPVPPNKDDFNTVVSYPGITQQEFNRLMGIDGGITIKLRLQYTDAYGGTYETGMCLERLAAGSVRYCQESYIK